MQIVIMICAGTVNWDDSEEALQEDEDKASVTHSDKVLDTEVESHTGTNEGM